MATEFSDREHYGLFFKGGALSGSTSFKVRQSELTLAALRAAGFLDNMVDGAVPPTIDKLWLDKNLDPAVLKEWDPVGANWQQVSNQTLFGRVPWRGAWEASPIYRRADLVSYQGSIWIAVQPSQNQIPAEGAYWNLFLPSLADSSVSTAKLINGSVTTPKLADKAVTPEKLADGVLAFATRAAAVAASINASIHSVSLKGDSTEGDGLGGLFIDTNNGNPNTFVSADSRTWYRVVSSNPKLFEFGAKGDGVTLDDVAVAAAVSFGGLVNGGGKVYRVASQPASFRMYRDAAFKVGKVIYPTRDFLRTDTAKITDGQMYNGWCQDKCYLAGKQIRVWVNEKESHPDGTGRIVLYFSDDGGASYSPGEYLNMQASGRTLWSAGYDAATNTEYLIVRVPTGTNDQAPFTYEVWKRVLGIGSAQNYNGAWTVTPTTFPVPSGFTGQPVMVHSFTSGHGGSIVVGASYGEGAAVMRSTNGGASWTATIIGAGTHYEEPTVKYHAASGAYCGFTRSGSASLQPSFWKSTDNLATVSLWDAPAGLFNGGVLAFSSISCDIDANGNLHAYTGYRTGVTEGAGTDERVSNFYLRGPIADNFFSATSTELFCLGQIPRREPGGSSALGNSSVVVDGEKVHLFYTLEEREGTIGGYGKGNRIADIAQTVIFLEDHGGCFDLRADLLANRFAGGQLRKAFGMDAFTIPFRDAANFPPAILISGRHYSARNPSTISISSDAMTIPANARFASYVIDTEGSASTDDLSTITDPAAVQGDQITLRTNTSSRDIVVKHNVGNIRCGSDKTLGTAFDRITLEFDGSVWVCVSFQQNSS